MCAYTGTEPLLWTAAREENQDVTRATSEPYSMFNNRGSIEYFPLEEVVTSRLQLFSSPSRDEVGICFKEYFTVSRVKQILQGLDIPLCQHLLHNSPYVLDTYQVARDHLHPNLPWDPGSAYEKSGHCLFCPDDHEFREPKGIHVRSPFTKCWARFCKFEFGWVFSTCRSMKTRATIVKLHLVGRWALSELSQKEDYFRSPLWIYTMPRWHPEESEKWNHTWQLWNQEANKMERGWLTQTPRRENCTLGPGESCLRSPSAPDPGFQEPGCRH